MSTLAGPGTIIFILSCDFSPFIGCHLIRKRTLHREVVVLVDVYNLLTGDASAIIEESNGTVHG